METSGAPMVALPLAAVAFQTPAKKALLPHRLQDPAKFWHFSSLHDSSWVPAVPPPLRLAPTHTLPAVSHSWWSHAAGWPQAGAPWCRDRGAAPDPSTQPLPAQWLGQRGSQKNVTLATLRDDWPVFPSFGQRGGVGNVGRRGLGTSLAGAPGLAHMACVHVSFPKWLRRDGCPCAVKGSVSPGCWVA